MDELYKENLVDHHKNPRNYGKLVSPSFVVEENNPLCGDHIKIYGSVLDKKLNRVKFEGKGCVICMASASILVEDMQGKALEEIKSMTREDMLDLLGIKLNPSREKCAMLSLSCLKKGVLEYKGETKWMC